MTIQKINLKEWETYELLEYNHTYLKSLLDLQQRGIIKTSISNNGVLISANSRVGFELNDYFSIEISPKISNLSVLRMIGFLHDFIPSSQEKLANMGSGQSSLLDFLIHQWLDLVEKLISKIRTNYVQLQSTESFIKGKINFNELAKQGILTQRIPIKYNQLQLNQPLNQVIKSGLNYFKQVTKQPLLINKINISLRSFTGIEDINLDRRLIESMVDNLTKLEESYKVPLKYLNWLLRVKGINRGKQTGKSFWIDMNSLFQSYLTKILSIYLPEYNILAEHSNHTIFEYDKSFNPFGKSSISIRPDLLVYSGDRLKTIIDFKYKNLFDKSISTADLYQLSNYGLSIGGGIVNPIILYPSNLDIPDQIIRVNLSVMKNQQKIILRGVNLNELERLLEYSEHEKIKKYSFKLLQNYSDSYLRES